MGGSWYSYKVQSCNAGGCSGWGSTFSFYTPKTVASLLCDTFSTGIACQFSKSTNNTYYVLERNSSVIYTGSSSPYFDYPTCGVSYTYRIKGCTAVGCSGYTYSISASCN
jgi:hypothetical protein